MPLPSKYKSEKEKPILSLTKGTLYRTGEISIPICRDWLICFYNMEVKCYEYNDKYIL